MTIQLEIKIAQDYIQKYVPLRKALSEMDRRNRSKEEDIAIRNLPRAYQQLSYLYYQLSQQTSDADEKLNYLTEAIVNIYEAEKLVRENQEFHLGFHRLDATEVALVKKACGLMAKNDGFAVLAPRTPRPIG